jgi:hypothetical protein
VRQNPQRFRNLKRQLDEVMKAQGMKKEMSPEQKAAVVTKNLENDIADLDRRIKEKDFSIIAARAESQHA